MKDGEVRRSVRGEGAGGGAMVGGSLRSTSSSGGSGAETTGGAGFEMGGDGSESEE